MKIQTLTLYFALTLSMLVLFSSCGAATDKSIHKELYVVSGSENETLEPLIQEFEKRERVRVLIDYKGSVDMMLEMSSPEFPYDAVWPANSLWISLGDTTRRIKHVKSIMKSPVALGIRKSLAEELGFVGRDVRVREILEAIKLGELSFMMTSATQSNSGASAYIGFLYALLGNPDIISLEALQSDDLKRDIRSLLSGIHRSSGSSGWLKELFLESDYDAMVNYEAILIETNQALVSQGKEPLYVVYPVDGIVMADSPLGYVDKGNEKKENSFLALQDFLLREEAQKELLSQGRRTGFAGIAGKTDPKVFNPDWGINPEKVFSPIKIPTADVLSEALRLFQSEFRKPSYTVFALDYSGSMKGSGEKQMKDAMDFLLDQDEAQRFMIQSGTEDVIVVVPFNQDVLEAWTLKTVNKEGLTELSNRVRNFSPGGGTNIYAPAMFALELMGKEENLDKYIPAVILLTDGEHTERKMKFRHLEDVYSRIGLDVPIFAILFGQGKESQLEEITELTRARIFDGRKDLIKAFRSVKGYN